MKKITKINPIAKELPKYGKRVVPDKRRDKSDKEARKEIRDAKTKQDTWAYKDLQSVDDSAAV